MSSAEETSTERSLKPWSVDEIEREAQGLLRKHRLLSVPVPIMALSRALGVEVFLSSFKNPSTSGAIIGESDRYRIYVNRAEAETRQRFTVAHELGHFLLHLKPVNAEDRGYLDEGVSEEDFVAAFRGSSRGPQEEEANAFAAAVLMPQRYMRIYGEAGLTVEEMARHFSVSPSAVRRRIAFMANGL